MLFLTAAAAAAALAADADTNAAVDEQKKEEQPIVVIGERLPSGAVEVQGRPGGSDLVTAAEFEDKLAVSLRETLAFSPGVYAQPRFGQEVRLSIRGSGISRGFHMRGLTLLQDGIPINLADDNGDFQELDPAVLSHLEVYRGANAFRFGGTTLGGAINGVTPTGRTRPGFNLRGDGGSFSTVRAQGSFGWSNQNADIYGVVNTDRSDGDRQHAKRRALRFQGNLGYNLAENAQTRVYISVQRLRQQLPGGLSYPLVVTEPKTGSFAGDQQRNIDSVRLQSRTTVALDFADVEFGGFVNAKKLDHPIFQVVDEQSVDSGVFARAGMEFGNLELLTGATARFGTTDAKRFVNINGDKGAQTLNADRFARTIDIYSEARYKAGSVTGIIGGIYTNGVRRQEQTFPTVVDGRTRFSQLSPRFGLLWEPRGDWQFYANYSRSHELPGFIELAQIAAFVPLEAQHGWTAEIGGRGTIGPAKFEVSFYRADVTNELLQFTVGPNIPASTFNADKTLHQGIEAGLDIKLHDWVSLRQVYALNDFKFRGDPVYGNNRLPVIAKHVYRGEVKIGPEAWHISPSLEWVPKGAFADYANNFRAPGYTMLGLSGSVTMFGETELFVDVRNINKRKAIGDISAVINYNNLLPFQRSIFYPVERRAFYVGMRSKI
ncbi:MAG: TonB-dependent receptor [Sphingomonas sp.]|nr:TonB-dependent receptor [Sphingomonas sp.]